MTDYGARQIYNELFAAGFSARELEFYIYWADSTHASYGVRLNPLDRRLAVVISQEAGSIRIRYWHDVHELHEGVPPFHISYTPDYATMLQELR